MEEKHCSDSGEGVRPVRDSSVYERKPAHQNSVLKGRGAAQPTMAVLPSRTELEMMLSSAVDTQSLVQLESASAALVEVAKRQRTAEAKIIEVAEWHLRVKRRLGLMLTHSVARGGARSRSQHATSPVGGLPKGLDKHAARRCRQLSAIPENLFSAYLRNARVDQRVPSTRGAISYANPGASGGGSPSRRRPSGFGAPRLTADAMASLEAAMGGVDMCIGRAGIEGVPRRTLTTTKIDQVDGTIVFTEFSQSTSAKWLDVVTERYRRGVVLQVAMLLSQKLTSAVESRLAEGEWRIVILRDEGGSGLLAYLGPRKAAIYAACRPYGLVVDVRGG